VYQAFFGLREKPFNLTPDPKFLYLNASYREALAALHYGIAERKGFVSLIGEAGTGKTTLLRRLLSELPREIRSVLVLNPAIGFEELLRFILTDLGRRPPRRATKLEMLEALNAELLDTLARGENVVVLIDEAQDLTIPVLEELRLLSNLETAKEKILQFVLAGQPEFDALLAKKEIRQLRQRIAVRARLRPLARSEVQAYIGARIAAAGGDVRGLFTRGGLLRVWHFSGGVPRLVNAACDNALVTAYATGSRTIGWREIGEAVRDLRRRTSWTPGDLIGRRTVSLLAAAVAGAVLVLGVSWLVQARRFVPPTAVVSAPPLAEPVPAKPAAEAAKPVAEVGEPAAEPGKPGVDADQHAVGAGKPVADAASVAAPDHPQPPTVSDAAGDASTPPSNDTAPHGPATDAPSGANGTIPADEPVASDAAAEPDAPEPAADEIEQGTQPTDTLVTIAPGDNLTGIARRYYGNASPRILAEIQTANPWLANVNTVRAGRTLVLPAPDVSSDED